MSTLTWIILMSVAGGLISVGAAALVSMATRAAPVSTLISYAIGAMLGAVFLDILPEALEHGDARATALTLLAGILVFFVLEKFVLWRHCHHDQCEAHDPKLIGHDHGRSGLMILVGDTFHNFVDGILIAAAFLQSVELGVVASFAIIAHEIPQELGDFFVLMHSGYSRAKALAFNALSGLATVVGGVLAYFALSELREWVPTILGFAAASLIYVAVADLIPGLHKRVEPLETIKQVSLILAGVASIWGVGELLSGHVH